MEYKVINTDSDEYLQHWGIKGQKWGVRRYQNKDGTLTPAGQKRYNKEMEKLKQETARVKAEEKIAANKKKTQAKIDKLEAKKQALEERKKALMESDKKNDDKPEETVEQKRERLLKSVDPKELYENKDILSSAELNDRINRIDLERRLQDKIVVEKKKAGWEYVNDVKRNIDSTTNLYKSIDNAYATVAGSAIGRTLAKKLGIELEAPKKEFNISDLWNKRNKLSDKEIQDIANRVANERKIEIEVERRAKKAAEEAEKKAQEKAAKKDKNAKDSKDTKGDSKKDSNDDVKESTDTKSSDNNTSESINESWRNTVIGEGNSNSRIKDEMDNGRKWWDSNQSSDGSQYNYDDYLRNNRRTLNAGQSWMYRD